MAVPKRKQLHDDKPSTETQSSTRRATRHHPTTSTDEPPKQLRSGRTRAGDADTKPDVRPNKRKSDVYDEGSRPASREGARRTAVPPPSIPSSPEETARTRTAAPPTKLRATRNKTAETATAPVTSSQTWLNPLAVETPISPPKHPLQLQSEHASLPSPGAPIIQSHNALQAPNGVSRPVGAPQKIIRPVPKSSEKLPQSSVANSKATIKTTPKRQSRPLKPPSTPGPDRNIDKVFLGNICFRAWFPSYYPKEVLADTAGNAGEHPARGVGKLGGGKNAAPPPILERLLVCPCCFKYSRELPTWWDHIRYCERRAYVPGRKVYTHPRAGVRQPKTNAMKHDHEEAQGDAGSAGLEDGGEWSVWEVDGEKDGLFCQNLSLFAKLFLDNKSVFFDVTGFNYFLLVYTPKAALDGNFKEYTNPQLPEGAAPSIARPQIVGFFSKEKVSWDNNNLACILVFPPWQRKGLGSLLMGVSYAISKREGVLGGPEKPISELGRKGYNRFWAGEVARWLLSLPASSQRADKRRAVKDDRADHEVLVDVTDCSEATWIVPEDCLQILRDMELLEDAGPGPAKHSESSSAAVNGEESKNHGGGAGVEGEEVVKTLPRVRLDKAAVQKWIETHRINLELTCNPDGFVPGYAIRQPIDSE